MDLASALPAWLGGEDATRQPVDWRTRVDDLLYDGETVERQVEVDEAVGVVVTSHRVLVFRPEFDGSNFEAVERPNVEGVRTGALAESDLLARGVQWLLVGVLLLAGGFLVNLDSLVASVDISGEGASRIGIGGFVGLVQTLLSLLAQLDDFLRIGGAILLFVGAVLIAAYVLGRERTMVLEIAGGEDVHFHRPAESTEATERLEAALGLRPQPDPDGRDGDTWSTAGHGTGADGADDPIGEP
jgi:hypothetical protein